MQAAMQPVLRQHASERAARRAEVDKRIDAALLAAEEIENNARACLGIELSSIQANQQQVEASAAKLRSQVSSLSQQFTLHNTKYEALAETIAAAGSVAAFLNQTDAVLKSINRDFAAIERALANEQATQPQ